MGNDSCFPPWESCLLTIRLNKERSFIIGSLHHIFPFQTLSSSSILFNLHEIANGPISLLTIIETTNKFTAVIFLSQQFLKQDLFKLMLFIDLFKSFFFKIHQIQNYSNQIWVFLWTKFGHFFIFQLQINLPQQQEVEVFI